MVAPVRERIIAALQTLFNARDAAVDGELVTWERVGRAPLGDDTSRFSAVCAVLEGREIVIKSAAPVITRRLEVAIEFEVKPYAAEEPAIFLNEVLADIQKTYAGDLQLGGLCLNMQETSNETDIESDGDRRVGGIVSLEITYRHMHADPAALLGG